jgi:hypothetical protein
MNGLDVMDLMLAFVSALAGAPFVLDREWATAVVLPRHEPPTHAWMAGPGAYQSFVAGGVRALIDRSPMRYDVAIYLGGGS